MARMLLDGRAMTRSATQRIRSRTRRAGFTLIELLVVVAMVGILAVIAGVGFRKYLHSAQTGEAKAVLQSIRAGQEAFRAEALRYLDVSGNLDNTYPRAMGDLNEQKAAWEGWAGWEDWQRLGIRTDGPVRFGYATVAGMPGDGAPVSTAGTIPFPITANDVWFVAAALGKRHSAGTQYAFIHTSSFTNEIFVENEQE